MAKQYDIVITFDMIDDEWLPDEMLNNVFESEELLSEAINVLSGDPDFRDRAVINVRGSLEGPMPSDF